MTDGFQDLNRLIDQNDTGEIRAFVYLGREGDQQNQCLLTAHFLVMVIKGQKQYFKLSDLRDIQHYERKLLLPLILGGVILPLSLVALSRDYFDPYIIMLAIFSSLYFIYRGWTGINIVAVNMNSGPEEILISNITDHLRAFIQYVNATLAETENELKRKA